MTPVEQRELHIPGDPNSIGDCWKCCIASILDLAYEDVPHFVRLEVEADARGGGYSYWNATQSFLREHGLVLAQFSLWGKERPWLVFGGEKPREYAFSAPGHWIAAVKSPRFMEGGEPGSHAVVMSGSSIAWDPHPQRDMGHLGFTNAYLLVKA